MYHSQNKYSLLSYDYVIECAVYVRRLPKGLKSKLWTTGSVQWESLKHVAYLISFTDEDKNPGAVKSGLKMFNETRTLGVPDVDNNKEDENGF